MEGPVLQNGTSDPMPSPRRRSRRRPKGRELDSQALAEVQGLLGRRSRARDLLIEHLHLIQDRYHHLSAAHLAALAHEMGLPQAEVYEVASFYHHFDLVKEGEAAPAAITVRVCDSVSCAMAGAETLLAALGEAELPDTVRIVSVPCVGRCNEAPVAVVGQNPLAQADLESVAAALARGDLEAAEPAAVDYARYHAENGYQTLLECVQGQRPVEEVIRTLQDANLRGLGGAGFPAGRKWSILREQPAPRLMAVNIDEGEPGTFKDRYYLERDPHRFLEGMLIAAWAVGVEAIYIYLRDEYAGIRTMLEREIAALTAAPPCPIPPIHLRRGAGAYICGEESAMIESIEGKRGMPRLRPPYVAEVGLFGRPTLEHNLETLYWVPDLLQRGAEWFTSEGRHGRSGLRTFSLSGRVAKPGVYLAPAGITVRELIDQYGGGMLDGHTFYAYFPGGASGGILPAKLGDIPLDFDTLNEYGCFIGSAAVIVLSRHDQVRAAAVNAMQFFSHESCGQCTPCRVGTAKAVNLMASDTWDQPLLHELGRTMADASICGLGQAAPNLFESVMRYFPQELSHAK